jgi:hypothetical protein
MMNMNKDDEQDDSISMADFGGITQSNITRKPYRPPILTHLEPGEISGIRTSFILEGSSGLLTSS